ncbi:hypothetical protein GCM10027406_28590 [Leifsonia lichenia]
MLSAGVFVLVSGGTASLVVGIVSEGITPRARGYLIGLGVFPFCLVVVSIVFRECVRVARDRVREGSGDDDVYMLLWSGSCERAFRALGILPLWRVRLFAVSIGPTGLRFWSGMRRPFLFATIRGSDIALPRSGDEPGGMRGKGPHRAVIQVGELGGNQAVLELEPLAIRGLLVSQGDPGETRRMRDALTRAFGSATRQCARRRPA